MKENSNQGKPCIVANARAVISLSDGRKIICTWVGVRDYDSGNKELNEWREMSIRGAINPECYKKNAACELLKTVFAVDRKIPGKMTCWNCDFQKGGINQDVINELTEMFNEIKDDNDWEEVFKPQLTIHNSDDEIVLLVFQGEIRSSKKGDEKVANNDGKKTRRGWSLANYIAIIDGEEIKMGEMKSSMARANFEKKARGAKEASLIAERKGKKKVVYKLTNSNQSLNKEKPQEVAREKKPDQENADMVDSGAVAKPVSVSVFREFGVFDEDGGGSLQKRFYAIQDFFGNKIAGGYLSEEETGLVQGFVDGLNKIFPGTFNLIEIHLTDNQVKEMVNSLLRLACVSKEVNK